MATMQTPQDHLLRKGSRGDSVRELQIKMHKLGFDLAADGIFGDETEKAVIHLQALFGYTVDGIVGPGTMRLIDTQIGHHWNVQLPNAQELALRAQGAQPGTEGGTGHGRMSGDSAQNVIETPRSPTTPDALHTAVPGLAGSTVAPGASKPAGGPGSTPSTTLPKRPPQGSPLKR